MKFNNRNVNIGTNVQLGANVRIGDDTTIYDNVVIGDNTIISNNCVIGEPDASYYRNIPGYKNPPTIIGKNSLIRSHCLIYSGSVFGDGLITGHGAIIREKAKVGVNCLISTMVDIQGNCEIGDYSRIYSKVHIGELTRIGKYVFVFPRCGFYNDPQPPSYKLVGSSIGDYSIIAVHCTILPGAEVGKNCFIGANSVVSKKIDDYSFCVGTPAVRTKDIREIKSRENPDKSHYPWMYNFERGMPWEGIGFDKWSEQQTK